MLNKILDSHSITDMMSEGLIIIDGDGFIRLYNKRAKEIFGVIYHHQFEHEKGSLHRGDFVIIADNSLGVDDGELDDKKLSEIGIQGVDIRDRDAIIAFGSYGIKQRGIVKVKNPPFKDEIFKESIRYKDKNIEASIDFKNQRITINVDKFSFVLPYQKAIGHMVVLDGETADIKFYQERGYSVRNEAIGQLLLKKDFRGKGDKEDHLKVVGKHLLEIHDRSSVIEDFLKSSTDGKIGYENRLAEINGRQTMCSLIPIAKGKRIVGSALKVEDITEIRKVIKERDDALKHLEHIEKKLKVENLAEQTFPKITGSSAEIRQMRIMVAKASKSSSNVLLLGESGTGKTMIAKAIHEAGDNFDKPFIHVNCGSIPENLLESELFGYEQGAFTGASTKGKKGYFEMANKGTLFLDEVGDLPLNLQVKLLHAIQHRMFYPLGSDRLVEVDVRIIAATNRNLEEEMKNGNFREDLYYRINVIPIWVPPLRDRKNDINPLVNSILPRICRERGVEEKHLTGEALAKLMKYHWPGNIRELENILERGILLSESGIIHSDHILIEGKGTYPEEEVSQVNENSLKESLKDYEKKIIIETLHGVEWNRKKAMEQLGVGKTQFYKKLKDYNII